MSNELTNTFQQRRQLAIAVSDLAEAENARTLAAAARDIYDTYPNELIQAELLKRLDTPDSQLRGGLGEVAALLPPEPISNALRSMAADRRQSAQRRLTAAMLASQYLGQPVPAALLSDLSQGNEVAFQSLLEAVEEGKRNRHVLLEYVLQMREAGDHVPPLILDLLDRLPPADRVELLRLIALDDRENVAINALARLELLAAGNENGDASATALRALHVLQFMLPPEIVGTVEDALRRLRFRGHVYRPPEAEAWRALLSTADVTGNQALWFVHPPSPDDADGMILYVTLNDYTGQLSALANEQMGTDEVPPKSATGQIVPVQTDAGREVAFLEVPFDFARWRLLQVMPRQWETTAELSPELRLYSDVLWVFDRPHEPPEIMHDRQLAGEDAVQDTAEDASVNWVAQTAARTSEFVADPAAQPWLRRNRSMVLSLPDGLAPAPDDQRAALVRAILVQFAQQPESEHLGPAIAAGLRAQAMWFELAGQMDTAQRARRLATAIEHVPVEQNALLAAIVEAELGGAD